MKMNRRSVLGSLCSVLLLMLLAGCSTTIEAQQQRFNSNTDNMELLATKKPMQKMDVMAKLASFKAEQAKIVAGTGDQKKALLALNRRMESYMKKLNPKPIKPVGSKLTGKPVGTPGATPGTAPGKAGIIRPGSAKPGMPAAPGKLGTVPGKPMGAPGKLGVAPGKPMAAPPGKLGAKPMAPASAPARPMAAPGKLGAAPAKPMAPAKRMAPAGKLGAKPAPRKLGAPSSAPTR